LHKQHGLILVKIITHKDFRTFSQTFKDINVYEFEQGPQNRRIVYPSGNPGAPHLLCYQGFAVDYYGFTLGRLGSATPSTFATLG